MRFALEQLGKKVTVIKGDSDLSKGFMHFPGAKDIVLKNFSEIDRTKYDLFIVLDSSTLDRVSGLVDVSSFGEIKLINIDHHVSNTGFGYINMIVSDYPATAQILYDLFLKWGIEINDNIATNLFIGIYTDTGGLKYRNVSRRTYEIMADLVTKAKNFSECIDKMENSNTPEVLAFVGLAMNNIRTFCQGRVAISAITFEELKRRNIKESDMGIMQISPLLRSVDGWDLDIALIETKPGKIKVGLRTRDESVFDLTKLATALGGGGHKSAAGALIKDSSIEKAIDIVVNKAKEIYNLKD
jgi:phosphoesterase RecJ-like protein